MAQFADLGSVTTQSINDAGRVVGTNNNNHAFITGPDGVGMTESGTLGGRYSRASGINAVGQVREVSAAEHILILDRGSGFVAIGMLR